jgi:hypothetical protein
MMADHAWKVNLVHCHRNTVRIGRHQDEMHVVRRQAPGPHLDPGAAAIFREQVAIKRIVSVAEKGARAAIATLGDMMRMTGDDDHGRDEPWGMMAGRARKVNLVHCHRNSCHRNS